jgi:hypothetical protein
VEQNWRSRNKPTQLHSFYFLTKEPKTYNGEKIASSTNGFRKAD